MRRLLLLLLLFLPSLAHSQETIVSYDKSSLSVLNEELRQSSSGLKTLRGQVADLLPLDLSDSSKVTSVLGLANGGTGQSSASASINALLPSQTGNSGKFLTTNGSTASWGTVTGGATMTAGTKVIYTYPVDITEVINSTTYRKIAEIAMPYKGTVSVYISANVSGTNGSIRLYKNGVAVGTEKSPVNGTQNWTDDIAVDVGDLLQIYTKDPNLGSTFYLYDWIIKSGVYIAL